MDFSKPEKIDLIKLSNLFMPFHSRIWQKCDKPITRKEIEEYVLSNKLQSPDIKVEFDPVCKFWDLSSRDIHLKRIAWLVQNFDDQFPIAIDFGVPNFGGHFEIIDGNHRLLAAYFLGKEYVNAECSGAVSEIEKFLYTKF